MKIHVFEKIRLQEASRGDLGRSWVDLGRPRGVKMRAAEGLKRCYVELSWGGDVEVKLRENRLFGENEGSRGDLGRSWVDLGRPRGVKMRTA